MPDIVVIRGSGVSQGEDIVDPLLTTTEACIARGRMELDDASGLHKVVNECIYRNGLMLGEMVEVFDPLLSTVQWGRITSITHRVENGEMTTTLQLMVPSEFVV